MKLNHVTCFRPNHSCYTRVIFPSDGKSGSCFVCLVITMGAKSTLMSYDQYWALNICSPQLLMSPEWPPAPCLAQPDPGVYWGQISNALKGVLRFLSQKLAPQALGWEQPPSWLWSSTPFSDSIVNTQTLGGSSSSRNPSWCCTDGITAMCLVTILCISYHSQSLIFVSKQAEGSNLSSNGLQSTLFFYLFTYLLTYFILNLKLNVMSWSKKTLERERSREREQWDWHHWEGYSISHLPVTVQMKILPFCCSLEKGGKGK